MAHVVHSSSVGEKQDVYHIEKSSSPETSVMDDTTREEKRVHDAYDAHETINDPPVSLRICASFDGTSANVASR